MDWPLTITKDKGNFMESVRVGDYVVATPPGSQPWITKESADTPVPYTSIRVVNVLDNHNLAVKAYLNKTEVKGKFEVASGTKYEVKRYLTTDQQIDRLVAIAAKYNSNRTCLIWPPVALWQDEDGELIDLGAPSIAACYAAAKTRYPAQQGFTNMPFAGPHRLKYSNDYFNREQLNRLSASGWAVFVQDEPGGAISCRHQVMSDGTESTIIQQIDKVSMDIKAMLKPMIGVWNITSDLLSALTGVITNYLIEATNRKVERCGSLIQGFTGPILRANLGGQNRDLPKTMIECRVNISFGHPFNNLDLIIMGE